MKIGSSFTMNVTCVALIGMLAAVAIPNYVKSRTFRSVNSCIDVHQPAIDAAKRRWAKATGAPVGTTPSQADLQPLLAGGRWPECPAGGTYLIGPIGEHPGCSLESHPWTPRRE